MKTTRFFIMTATCLVAFMFAFVSCDPEIIPPIEEEDPYVIAKVESITKTSAVLVAQVMPNNNDDVTISFQYAASNSTEWNTYTFEEKVSGSDFVIKSFEVSSLKPGTSYKFRALANDVATKEKVFNTVSVDKAKIFAYPAEKVTKTTALVKAAVVAGIEDTATVSFKYSIKGENKWQTITLPQKFFGTDTVKLNFDLSDLKLNTRYEVLFEIANSGGISTAKDSIFTYAVNDFDGNLYHTVTIGDQTWLRENFRGTHFANGDAISNVTDGEEWANLSTPAYCWYNNDPEIGKVYGGLYNWWVGADPRGLIQGFRTPTSMEFGALGNYLTGGLSPEAGPALMEAGTAHWKTPAKMGTNSSDFTGLPNGARGDVKYGFMNIRENLCLWTNNKDDPKSIAALTEIDYKNSWFQPGNMHKKSLGAGIRLIKK